MKASHRLTERETASLNPAPPPSPPPVRRDPNESTEERIARQRREAESWQRMVASTVGCWPPKSFRDVAAHDRHRWKENE